ncbi:MAG TPA: CDP-archaeol synthase [Candidatus Paceibacterota bacterium]|nr:CDP-archaeol synthase [Candidatus Paceibacterota bacterium]HRZ34327.1 CDP-archaeol synthase [Candidatus Paceibacterota bacterium]
MKETFSEVLMFMIPPMLVNGTLNLLYPLRKKISFFAKLDRPIDFGKSFFDGRRILGDSTTLPGILVAVVIGPIAGVIFYGSLYLGFIAGVCTYLGHAAGSFIKRRANVSDSKFLPIIDHSDYIIFTGLVWLYLELISLPIFLISWVVILVIQPVFCYIGYKLGLRAEPL